MFEIESDTDRFSYRELGGSKWITQNGAFWALFDAGFTELLGAVEARDPFLTCSTLDVTNLGLVRDDSVRSGADQYRIKRHEPDGTGISRLILKR